MRIAVPVAEGRLCAHFGHCESFALIEADDGRPEVRGVTFLTPPPHAPGVLPEWLRKQGVTVVIAGGMGRRAQDLFAQAGVTVVTGAPGGTPEDLALAYLKGTLVAGANVCDH